MNFSRIYTLTFVTHGFGHHGNLVMAHPCILTASFDTPVCINLNFDKDVLGEKL